MKEHQYVSNDIHTRDSKLRRLGQDQTPNTWLMCAKINPWWDFSFPGFYDVFWPLILSYISHFDIIDSHQFATILNFYIEFRYFTEQYAILTFKQIFRDLSTSSQGHMLSILLWHLAVTPLARLDILLGLFTTDTSRAFAQWNNVYPTLAAAQRTGWLMSSFFKVKTESSEWYSSLWYIKLTRFLWQFISCWLCI